MAMVVAVAWLLPTGIAPAERASAQTVLTLPDYRVGIGDKLKITVYNSDKLNGEYLVGGDGKISFPILGRVSVGGLTLDGIKDVLTAKLAEGYLQRPNVTVDMLAYRAVYVLGEVQKPGQYAYTEGMTVFQLVAQAGGFTYRANRKTVKLRHEGEVEETKYIVTNASEVKPGDTLIILERFF